MVVMRYGPVPLGDFFPILLGTAPNHVWTCLSVDLLWFRGVLWSCSCSGSPVPMSMSVTKYTSSARGASPPSIQAVLLLPLNPPTYFPKVRGQPLGSPDLLTL